MKKGFSKIIIFCIVVILIGIGIMGLYEAEVIRTYKITDFEIDAVINKDGSMTVKETTEYRFNGRYNGITITIPENINSKYYDKMTEDSINDSVLSDSLYNNKGIKDVSIYVVEDDKIRMFDEVGTAEIGIDSVYTISKDLGYTTYKIFEPSKNEKKTFVIEYTLEDVAVMHNDCSEIWWNFIGGGVECKISKLRLNISTAHGDILEGYIHSNESGKINYIEDGRLNATVSSISKNEFVGMRVVFPRQNIEEGHKSSNINALDIIHEQEQSYEDKSGVRIILNIISILITSGLLLYWIYLILRYEKEILYIPENIDDLKILEKYNPMIAACIAQNRGMHPRDILAVLIDMVNRKILHMETINSLDAKTGKDNITYKLSKNKEFFQIEENFLNLDEIERSILDIFFGERKSINLETRLNILKKEKKSIRKVKALDEKVTSKLESIGANFVRVPGWLLALNNFIFGVVLIYIFVVIGFNITLNFSTLSTTAEEIKETTNIILIILVICVSSALPLLLYAILLILKLIHSVKKMFSKLTFKLTSKKITQSILYTILMFILVFTLEIVFFRQSYIIISTILFMMGIMLILTDNLMSSHSMKIRNDFFYLKGVEDKILNGSLLDEKKIQDQVLWDKYLSFAIALGVGDVANLVKNIPMFSYLEDYIEDVECVLLDRDDITSSRLDNFENAITKLLESGSSGGSSRGGSFGGGFSGGSSFGGGGFSGGGRRRRRQRSLLKNKVRLNMQASLAYFFVFIYNRVYVK